MAGHRHRPQPVLRAAHRRQAVLRRRPV